MPYQTFPGSSGDSDSAGKLARMHLPEDLSGLSFLDIACNEGFFCQEAHRRNARRVVGIDRNPDFIEKAQARDPSSEYRVMDWTDLPSLDETFDVILLLSALHYATEPERLLRDVLDLLSPDGLFVLEAGIAPGFRPEWTKVERPVGDMVSHPTELALMRALWPAAAHRVGPSVQQPGDPIARNVYHVQHLKPMALLLSGSSHRGKSTLARALDEGGGSTISLDHLIMEMPSWCNDERLLQLRQSSGLTSDDIHQFVDVMVRDGVEEAFIDQVLSTQRPFSSNPKSKLAVIEGYALSRGDFLNVFSRRLTELGWFVWHVEPRGEPHQRWAGL